MVLPTEPIRKTKGTVYPEDQVGPGAQEQASLEDKPLSPSPQNRDPDNGATISNVDIVANGIANIFTTTEERNDSDTKPESDGGADGATEQTLYCPECYLPLHPDPMPEKLYIFLHAIRYTTSLGSFETEMPDWASPDFDWER